MNSQNQRDKEFINKVWQKVDRLERLEEARKRKMKMKMKMILIYLVCPIIVTIPFIINNLIDSSLVILLGIYLMSVACYFDNYRRNISNVNNYT